MRLTKSDLHEPSSTRRRILARTKLSSALALLLLVVSGESAVHAQDQVAVRVDATQKIAPFKPIYAFFGYDEPNYTTQTTAENSSLNWRR